MQTVAGPRAAPRACAPLTPVLWALPSPPVTEPARVRFTLGKAGLPPRPEGARLFSAQLRLDV